MKKILLILLVFIIGYWLNNKVQNWMNSTFKPKNKIVRDFDDAVNTSLDTNNSDSLNKPSVDKSVNESPDPVMPTNAIEGDSNYQNNSEAVNNQNENIDNQSSSENNKVSLPDGNLVYKNEIPSGTLVSCQTQIQNCEPKDQQQYDDPSVNTFCITYANYCISSDSIQRTWAETDVFKPAQENLNDPNTIPQDDYNQQQYQDPNQIPIHPDYPQEPVPQYDPPPPPDFYNQQPPSEDQGSYPDQGFMGKLKTFV